MSRVVFLGGVMLVVTAVVAAQDRPYPIFTVEQLDATMRTVGPNVRGIGSAIAEQDLSTAKERAIRAREQLAPTVTFWRDRGRRDAIDWLRETLDQLDALDTALSREEVDLEQIAAIVREVGTGCRACHEVYRDEDPDTGAYRLRRSALP